MREGARHGDRDLDTHQPTATDADGRDARSTAGSIGRSAARGSTRRRLAGFWKYSRHRGWAASSCGCCGRRLIARAGSVAADASGGGFGGSTLAGWFDDHERLINEAHRLRGVSAYVTFNPVRSDLLARSDNRLTRARHTTRDADIVCLRWLYLDIDPLRPAEISSTEAELGRGDRSAATRSWATIPSSRPRRSGAARATVRGSWSGSPTIPTTSIMPRFWPGRSRPSTSSTATTPSGSIQPRPIPRG